LHQTHQATAKVAQAIVVLDPLIRIAAVLLPDATRPTDDLTVLNGTAAAVMTAIPRLPTPTTTVITPLKTHVGDTINMAILLLLPVRGVASAGRTTFVENRNGRQFPAAPLLAPRVALGHLRPELLHLYGKKSIDSPHLVLLSQLSLPYSPRRTSEGTIGLTGTEEILTAILIVVNRTSATTRVVTIKIIIAGRNTGGGEMTTGDLAVIMMDKWTGIVVAVSRIPEKISD
jgi:hypothetical protein